MTLTLGSGNLIFGPVEGWEDLHEGWAFVDVAGVAVDSGDNVYVFNRGEHPVVVFDREGNFLRSWGEGAFTKRTHGIHIGPDDSVYWIDDEMHVVQSSLPKESCSYPWALPTGLLSSGEASSSTDPPTPRYRPLLGICTSPTAMANVYIADRENHRIQVFDSDGRFLTMWNNIHRPDGLCLDADQNLYVGELNGFWGTV